MFTERQTEARGKGLSHPGPRTWMRGFWALLGAETCVHSPQCSPVTGAVASAQEGQGQSRGLALMSRLSLFEPCTCPVSPQAPEKCESLPPTLPAGLPGQAPLLPGGRPWVSPAPLWPPVWSPPPPSHTCQCSALSCRHFGGPGIRSPKGGPSWGLGIWPRPSKWTDQGALAPSRYWDSSHFTDGDTGAWREGSAPSNTAHPDLHAKAQGPGTNCPALCASVCPPA